jgi:hypothetical protein
MSLVRSSARGLISVILALSLTSATACQRRGAPTDRGGAATGDDIREGPDGSGAGSAASNDSLLEQVPPARRQMPAHDEAGRDTVSR